MVITKEKRIKELRSYSVRRLLDELGWDYDRLTEGGKEVYDLLWEKIVQERMGQK